MTVQTTTTAGPIAVQTGSSSGPDRAGEDSPERGEPLREDLATVPARLLASSAPVYPPTARASEAEADVPLSIVIDTSGRVVDAKVIVSAGHPFDEAALMAVRAYRFLPAQRNGARVRVRMRWVVQFRLR
jgi:TonB family protein